MAVTHLGRFVSRDTLGYVDGMSLYAGYFAVRGIDPFGRKNKTAQLSTIWNAKLLKVDFKRANAADFDFLFEFSLDLTKLDSEPTQVWFLNFEYMFFLKEDCTTEIIQRITVDVWHGGNSIKTDETWTIQDLHTGIALGEFMHCLAIIYTKKVIGFNYLSEHGEPVELPRVTSTSLQAFGVGDIANVLAIEGPITTFDEYYFLFRPEKCHRCIPCSCLLSKDLECVEWFNGFGKFCNRGEIREPGIVNELLFGNEHDGNVLIDLGFVELLDRIVREAQRKE